MVSVSNKVDTFENLVAAIHNQLKALKESNDKLTSQLGLLSAKMESNIKKMDLGMNSRFQDMNSRVDDLNSDLNSGFEEMTQKNDKTSIKMEALNKNTMSRFGKILAGVPPDA
ncbi:hypothetical protein E4U47_007546 [Claviceps purpurea]|nr:hypothetical protein E4U47_007546 [Claviceps purpurea]